MSPPDALPARDRPLHRQPRALLLVLAGGAAGTAARIGIETVAPAHPGRWPWGTFTANLVGALVLGVLLDALARSGPDEGARRRLRLLIGTGFCGGLTTYSTLAVETDLLVRDHAPGLAIGYVATTVVLGALAALAGIRLVQRATRGRS